MTEFPDTFCICGLGPFTVDRHGIYDEDRTMGDCPRCGMEIPRTDPGRDATVEYYRGLLREAEGQNDAVRLQEENRELREALEFYADPARWDGAAEAIWHDAGGRARAAVVAQVKL
jgi:hypothetical protein